MHEDNSKAFGYALMPVVQFNNKVIVDLSHLRFVNSAGLGVLLSCLRQVNAAGGDLKLCMLSPSVRAQFDLVRMHRVLRVFTTQAEAIRAFHA